jgi:hypothetical protein
MNGDFKRPHRYTDDCRVCPRSRVNACLGWDGALPSEPIPPVTAPLVFEQRCERTISRSLARSFGLPWACTSSMLRGALISREGRPRQSTSTTPSVTCSSGPPPFLGEVAAEARTMDEPKISLALSSNHIPVRFPPCPPLRGHRSRRFAFVVRRRPAGSHRVVRECVSRHNRDIPRAQHHSPENA